MKAFIGRLYFVSSSKAGFEQWRHFADLKRKEVAAAISSSMRTMVLLQINFHQMMADCFKIAAAVPRTSSTGELRNFQKHYCYCLFNSNALLLRY